MNELQNAVLGIAKEIHIICEEYGIRYMMQGGTMLGAIRHKGFIPWDDDIDLGMTWDNYQRFLVVISKLSHPWLSFDIPSKDNVHYGNFYVKVYDKRTTLVEIGKQKEIRGVFVDVFPITYGRDTVKETLYEWRKFQLARALLNRKNYVLHDNFSLKDSVLNILSYIVPRSALFAYVSRFYSNRSRRRTKYSMAFDGTEKDVVLSDYYESPYVLYQFENTQLYGVKDYHSWLTDVFKNYMKLPPENQRVPHHYLSYSLSEPYPMRNDD